MNTELGPAYLRPAIESLVEAIGIKEPAPQRKLEDAARKGEVEKCISGIAHCLGLPVRITLSRVPKGYRPDGPHFVSQSLSKVDDHGHGISGITAQVTIPNNLPLFGTKDLENFLVPVRVSDDATENPSTFVGVMAHELSHVLLYSLRHPDRDDEFKTDLTAMLLGFAQIMKQGRSVSTVSTSGNVQTTRTTTYGYLSDDDFRYAFDAISKLRESRRAFVNEIRAQIEKLRAALNQLTREKELHQQYLARIDAFPPRRMAAEHAREIALLHSPSYLDSLELVDKRARTTLGTAEQAVRGLVNYSNDRAPLLRRSKKALAATLEEVERLELGLAVKNRVARRHTSLVWRLRLFWHQRFAR